MMVVFLFCFVNYQEELYENYLLTHKLYRTKVSIMHSREQIFLLTHLLFRAAQECEAICYFVARAHIYYVMRVSQNEEFTQHIVQVFAILLLYMVESLHFATDP